MRLRFAGTCMLCLAMASSHASRERWVMITPHAEWEPGYSFAALTFQDSLWLLGHGSGNWYSGDGRHWTRAAATDSLGGYNAYVQLDGVLYAIGGAENQTHPTRKAVWRSTDGRRWQRVTDAPAWSARVWHTATVHDGRIWLLGGFDGLYRHDVWFSADGARWQLATANAPWDG